VVAVFAPCSEGSNSVGTKYYYAGSVRVAVRVGTVLDYLFSDHLGSTSITADSAGNLAGGMRYTAWGETRYTAGTTPTSFRYTGQRQAEAGLYFYVARYYDPALGRFLSADTVVPGAGNPRAYDRYAYVFNNPVRFRDSTGHIPIYEGSGSYADQWRQEKAFIRLGEIGFMKYEIKYEFGIRMVDGTRSWNITNLNTAYGALKMINDTLNGNLKSMVGGIKFTAAEKNINPNDKTCENPNCCLYSGEAGSTGLTFYLRYTSGQIPLVNYLHETGHLLNMVPATANVFTGQIPESPTWVDKDGYVDRNIVETELGRQPIQAHPMGEAFDIGEYWADAFANFVATNINLSTPGGKDMYGFVSDALAPYQQ
jgi:RHS repeat-associated protein